MLRVWRRGSRRPRIAQNDLSSVLGSCGVQSCYRQAQPNQADVIGASYRWKVGKFTDICVCVACARRYSARGCHWMGKCCSSGSAAPVCILTLQACASVASDAELLNAKHFILSFGRNPRTRDCETEFRKLNPKRWNWLRVGVALVARVGNSKTEAACAGPSFDARSRIPKPNQKLESTCPNGV